MSVLDSALIRILLIDSHALVRAGLRLLLESSPGFQVIGEAGHIADAMAIAYREQPDIILFEAVPGIAEPEESRLAPSYGSSHNEAELVAVGSSATEDAAATLSQPAPPLRSAPDFTPSNLYSFIAADSQERGVPADSVDFIPALFEVAPDAQIIVLTGSNDGQLHRRVVAQGAKGLLQKDCSPEVLMRAIECVYTGEVWIERTMMASVLAEIAQTGAAAAVSRPPTPTSREREVIVLLCEGLPNRQIAARLCISETTVRRHLTTIFSKLGVADRLELVIYAYRHGLAGLPD